MNHSYAKLQSVGQDVWTCNFPGTDLNGAVSAQSPLLLVAFVTTTLTLWSVIS